MKKILIIDDVGDFRYFLKKNLEMVGDYKVIGAGTGEEGLRLAKKKRPDLILLDIVLPKVNGLEVLRELKEGERTRPIPVIMLTSSDEDENRMKTMNLHGDGYIDKCSPVLELEDKIEEVLYRCCYQPREELRVVMGTVPRWEPDPVPV